jgi:hypothetical protein
MEDVLSETTPESTEVSADESAAGVAANESGDKPARRGRGASKATGNGRRTAAKKAPAKRGAARRSSAPRATGDTRSSGDRPTSASLAAALRELLSGIEQEVEAITGLSQQIDEHVSALNGLREDASQRLLHLDELRAAADDVNLGAFLDDTIQPQFPQVAEHFPPRIYGSS